MMNESRTDRPNREENNMARLFEVYTVHCFLTWCPYEVSGPDPRNNHDRMERHYIEAHPGRWKGLP